ANYGFTPRGSGAKAHRWSMEENDRALLDAAASLDGAAVESTAGQCRNACGPGAVSAAVSAGRAMGATSARVLHHTTSALEREETDPDLWVGYAAVVTVS
ncbi:MAG: AmmeMemoRadiSam system protein B, partial [Planctomycetota bacterium]